MLPKTCLASLLSAASVSGRYAQQYLNRIIDPKVDSLFVIPYIVVQEVISSFSRNDNSLILIIPAVKRGIHNFGTLLLYVHPIIMMSNGKNITLHSHRIQSFEGPENGD